MDREWTDKRMDDFARGVDRRFDEVDRRFNEVDRRFTEVDRRFDKVDSRFDRIESKLDRLIYTAWGGIAVAAIVKLLSG